MEFPRWEILNEDDMPTAPPSGGGKDAHRPPRQGGGSSSSGISTGGVPGFAFDPLNPHGSVAVATPSGDPPSQGSAPNGMNPNLGWNSGARSAEVLPADWVGQVVFDVPDVQGARPGGVAIGLAAVSALPTVGRSGYGHLQYGLVFTADEVRVLFGGTQAGALSYADVRAERSGGATTDTVRGLLYGDRIVWKLNGALMVGAGPFSMPDAYVLDATLYSAFDAVDNPAFIPGAWEEDGVLTGALQPLAMTAGVEYADLAFDLPALTARLSENVDGDLTASLPALEMTSGGIDAAGLAGALTPLQMLAYGAAGYAEMRGALQPLQMTGGMEKRDSLNYSILAADLPRLYMTAEAPKIATIVTSLPALQMRASSETTYSELATALPGLRMVAYGGGVTPLLQIMEFVGGWAPVLFNATLGVAVIERVGGASTAVLALTMTADAMEEVTAQDALSALQTFLADAFEQLGTMDRVRMAVFRDPDGAGPEPGRLVDDTQTWVVNTASQASTRYDSYGFNSFAAFGGKHFGARADGVYLLEGADDAGWPIASGVALGMHDFGTQALKHIDAVYAGVSSTGTLFLKVGDGTKFYTYRARRKDDRMKVQRFDLGRGLRTNYFTFDLTSEADAFELDSVTFNVLASQRRI